MEATLGRDHPHALTCASALALVLQELGELGEAELLQRSVLDARQSSLGLEHPDTLASMSNLAMLLQLRGLHDEAESLQRCAAEGLETALGASHPNTLVSRGALALLLERTGELGEAESLHRGVLRAREETLGERHPDTLTSLSNLAVLLHLAGRREEAEVLQQRALVGREEALGRSHPDTRQSFNNLMAQHRFLAGATLREPELEGSAWHGGWALECRSLCLRDVESAAVFAHIQRPSPVARAGDMSPWRPVAGLHGAAPSKAGAVADNEVATDALSIVQGVRCELRRHCRRLRRLENGEAVGL
mmetsp:Transcript_49999/g.154991  ORF Transcript_49999/g.154991 Transcript_49999/m.154991 type:complete len:305 (-) Transcript_49999:169-1083(-)